MRQKQLNITGRICYQCHLKLPKQTTSYGEGDTQELSAPISEEDDQFYNFRERHIVKGDHLHENKTVSFIDSQEKTDSEPPSINSSQASSWSIEDNNDIPLENINTALSLLSNGKFSPVKHKIRNDLDSLQPSSRRALKRKATSAVEALLESLAPGQGTELMAMIKGEPATTELTDNSVTDLRKTIIKLYNNSNDFLMKRQTLSMLSKNHTKKQLMEMIPGLSTYSIDQARLHASMYGEGAHVSKPLKLSRQRMDQEKMAHALDFLFNPLFHQVSSYGTKEMKLDSGEKIEIPEVVRTVCHANLIHMYEAFCTESDFVPLSKSSLFQILRVCPASKRTSLKGLDNISADGATAFENIDVIINQMKQFITDPSMIDRLQKIKEDTHACKLYIKTDFKLHLGLEDQCADHCVQFALSDPNDSSLQAACAHDHDMTCDRCQLLSVSLVKLKKILSELQDFPEDLNIELLRDIELSESNIMSWRQHIVRCFNQDRGRTTLLDGLKPGEVLVIMDWAMKFLPLSFREKQSEWFGQKGLNWHVCVCIYKDNEQNLKHRTYIHVFDFVRQDWFAVVSILEHTLITLKSQLPELTTAFIRSDNAGCYHCILIRRYDFSESQDGKSYCDAKIAHLRSKIRHHVAAGNDVKTAGEMKKAIDSMGGVTGCQAAHVEINSTIDEESNKKKTTWKGITKISNINIRENQIVAWKSFEIGQGNIYTEEDLKKICPSPPSSLGLIVHETFILPSKEEGMISRKKNSSNLNEEAVEPVVTPEEPGEPEISTRDQRTFSCIEPGCSKIFQSFSKLESHILFGKHKIELNRKTTFDLIKNKWKDSCSSIVEHSVLSRNSRLDQGLLTTQMGWALKKERRNVRFDEKVKDYLRGIFAGGEGSGRKANAADVARNMRVCRDEAGGKLFAPSQYLLPSQIASFFSRLSILSHNPRQQQTEDEDLESAIQMIEVIEAIDTVNSS
ncbi:unnamed protein product [Mytilus edulis]|uniref:C2H2-type domain-containing protein n=1 Tax=Mytilus edulis TaxID=6550 RepID=A0A8S3UMR7_MYTED|nr:unnamed protein product [Mytilus edulis]